MVATALLALEAGEGIEKITLTSDSGWFLHSHTYTTTIHKLSNRLIFAPTVVLAVYAPCAAQLPVFLNATYVQSLRTVRGVSAVYWCRDHRGPSPFALGRSDSSVVLRRSWAEVPVLPASQLGTRGVA